MKAFLAKLSLILIFSAVVPAHAKEISPVADSVDTELAVKERHLILQLKSEPENLQYNFEIARVYAWQGQYEKALFVINKLLNIQPENSDYLLLKSQALFWSGQLQQSLQTLEYARKISPEYEALWELQYKVLQSSSSDGSDHALKSFIKQAKDAFPKAGWIKFNQSQKKRFFIQTEVEVGTGVQALSGNRDEWENYYLESSHKLRSDQSLNFKLEQSNRFSLVDNTLLSGLSTQHSEYLTSYFELSGSPQYHVLPKNAVSAKIQRLLARKWYLHAGIKLTEYEQTDSETMILSIEKYWSAYRAMYTLYATRVNGNALNSDTCFASNIALDYYYSESSQLGISFTAGEELEYNGTSSPPVSDISAVSIKGRHWWNNKWSISYLFILHEQGDIYRRNGIQIGVRYRY